MEEKINNNESQSDKEYYDMSKHLKECYDKIEREKNMYKEQNDDLKKVIMMCYSMFRLLSDELDNDFIDEMSISHLVELGRTNASNCLHEFII